VEDLELKAMSEIVSALEKLNESPDAQKRVLAWLNNRFAFMGFGAGTSGVQGEASQNLGSHYKATGSSTELDGVALKTSDDDFKITLRDLKAKNKIDAASRLTHIAVFAYQNLMKQPAMPSKVLVGVLEEWRLYDGNTRGMIASHKGIIRTKEGYTLDVHAKREAENFISEVLDSGVTGTWSPSSKTNKKNKSSGGKQ
jgi:hypothetical protein